jgi:hypothetical protein
MRTLTIRLLFALLPASAAAQERPPIIDMHLHAVAADALGPPPLAMCTPMPFPASDPDQPYGELFVAIHKNPPCPDPVWSPETDEELMTETIAVMNRLNIVGVLSEYDPDPIARWMAAAPGRFIPGLVLRFSESGAAFSTDSLRSLHAAGRLAVLGEVVNQYAGIAPDDERMELDAMLIEVGSGRWTGGGMKVLPKAVMNDGLLDVCVVEALSKLAFLRAFPRVFLGSHTTHPKVRMRTGTRVQVEADRRVLVYADGELVGSLPAIFEVRPTALPVVVGPDAKSVR